MTIIKCLAEKIEDELHDASDYVELALKWKDEQPETADLFYELSVEEMGHMTRLHEHVQELIENHRKQHGEPPKEMMVLYEYLHEKHKTAATQIKVKQGMYKLQEE
jgi:ferritin